MKTITLTDKQFDNLFDAICKAKETYLSWQQKQKQPKNLLLK